MMSLVSQRNQRQIQGSTAKQAKEGASHNCNVENHVQDSATTLPPLYIMVEHSLYCRSSQSLLSKTKAQANIKRMGRE